MNKRILITALAAILSGCVSYQRHPWSVDATFNDSDVEYLDPIDLSLVKRENYEKALKLLDDVSWVRLDKDSYRQLAQNSRKLNMGENVYLVRGTSWSDPPLFSFVAWDSAKTTLYVTHYTYNGEIFIPGKRVAIGQPVVVILEEEISAVKSDSIIGGDTIAGWSFREKAWRHNIQ